MLRFTPIGVIKVHIAPLKVFCDSINLPALCRSLMSSSLSKAYSLVENFISHRFTILSARSMTISICAPSRDKDRIVNYINRQREHHKERTFEQEYKEMIERSGLEWNDYRLT